METPIPPVNNMYYQYSFNGYCPHSIAPVLTVWLSSRLVVCRIVPCFDTRDNQSLLALATTRCRSFNWFNLHASLIFSITSCKFVTKCCRLSVTLTARALEHPGKMVLFRWHLFQSDIYLNLKCHNQHRVARIPPFQDSSYECKAAPVQATAEGGFGFKREERRDWVDEFVNVMVVQPPLDFLGRGSFQEVFLQLFLAWVENNTKLFPTRGEVGTTGIRTQ